ncbi:poly(ADP-ribose) polymerase [Trifolium repens]|nr:poly(ADP-ribose) polymerase [Trifolium repens]
MDGGYLMGLGPVFTMQGGEIYDAVLNQTNVGDNKNTFFVIQVLDGLFLLPISNFLAESDEGGKEEESTVKESPSRASRRQPQKSKLEPRIAKFISLVCNLSMMNQQMMKIGYNANKLPLGKLSKSTIFKHSLWACCREFYTVSPHDIGFKKMREFVIDTPQKLKRKLEMGDPFYAHYQRLHCELVPVEFGTEEFPMIENYMKNTHTKSIQTILWKFSKYSGHQKKAGLNAFGRLSNWTGILSQGLRIAPPEAPVTSYMFGKGVYFADMFSKSANNCRPTPTAADGGVLPLCEVALGEMVELLTGKYDADLLPEGKLSTKGVGATAPDFSKTRELEDGLIVPMGKPKRNTGRKICTILHYIIIIFYPFVLQGSRGSLWHNEYIVYNVDQIKMRNVFNVKFKFKNRS